jgi:ubiquinone/menaquinone biosynthesis C-methylase UbiE
MNVEQAYNQWAPQYDTNLNKTRDLEAIAKKEMLANISFDKVLEIGCGTGKNTLFLAEKASSVMAIDLSEEMLALAKQKVDSEKVTFKQADITREWEIPGNDYDLATFSLVLEHINNIDYVFAQLARYLKPGGYLYVGELHPFRQYSGSKARFETEEGLKVVTCYTHHFSDFTRAAVHNGFHLVRLHEFFDEDDRTTVPRIMALLFQKFQA